MKKILVLVFVSAVILLSCSADGGFSSTTPPPEWKGGPASIPGGGGNPSGGGGDGGPWCYIYDYFNNECDCVRMENHTTSECYSEGGDEVLDTCPSGCGKYNW